MHFVNGIYQVRIHLFGTFFRTTIAERCWIRTRSSSWTSGWWSWRCATILPPCMTCWRRTTIRSRSREATTPKWCIKWAEFVLYELLIFCCLWKPGDKLEEKLFLLFIFIKIKICLYLNLIHWICLIFDFSERRTGRWALVRAAAWGRRTSERADVRGRFIVIGCSEKRWDFIREPPFNCECKTNFQLLNFTQFQLSLNLDLF